MIRILCIIPTFFRLKYNILFLAFTANIFLLFTGLALADMPVLDLDPRTSDNTVIGHIEFFEDTTHNLTFEDIQSLQISNAFSPVEDSIDFGGKNATYWLHFRIENTTTSTQDWVFNTGSQRMRQAAVFFIRGGIVERLQLDSLSQNFTDRPIQHRLLLADLRLSPSEEVEVFITYTSAKSSYFPLEIMTPEAFRTWDAGQTKMIVLVLGAIIVLAIYTLFMFFTVGNLSHIYYLIFIVATFMYLLHQFGFSFQYLWPNQPYYNSYAAAWFGYTAGISGLMFGRTFFNVREISRYLDWIYIALAGIFFAGSLILYVWTSGVLVGVFGFLFGTIAAVLNMSMAIIRFRGGDVSSGFAAVGWSMLIIWGIVINVTSFGMFQIPQQLIFDNFYMIYAVAALGEVSFLTLSLFVRTRQTVETNRRERQNYIRMLEDEAKSATELAIAMQERQAAIEDAARKGRLVESMAHDIRQPLHAMRLTQYGADSTRLNSIASEAIDMIEGVLTTAFAVAETEEVDGDIYLECVSAQNILLPISLVFTPEARDAGLDLRVVPSSIVISTDRRILMRILNNLVTNAMRFTPKGQVLVGCRRRENGVGFMVLDTGLGMVETDVKTAVLPYVQHESDRIVEGQGLGLAICQRLCSRIGAELRISSVFGRGTVVEVFIDAR